MAIVCTPTTLEASAACFNCLTPKQQVQVQTYLLAVIAGGSLDPKTLLASAACFACLTPVQQSQVQAYLLCKIQGG